MDLLISGNSRLTLGKFTSTNNSVLYVSNFHLEPAGAIFNAGSSACSNLIALGSMAAVFAIAAAALHFHTSRHNKTLSKNMRLSLAIFGFMCVILSLAVAITAQVGSTIMCSTLIILM